MNDLLFYVKQFDLEQINVSKFEKINTRQFRSEEDITRNIYYKHYLTFLNSYKYLDIKDFYLYSKWENEILYNHYLKYSVILFAINFSVQHTFKKDYLIYFLNSTLNYNEKQKILHSKNAEDKEKYTTVALKPNMRIFIEIQIFKLFIYKLEQDLDNRLKFFKSRNIKEWQSIYHVFYNELFEDSKDVHKDFIFLVFESLIAKCYLKFVHILVELGYGKAYLDFSSKTSIKETVLTNKIVNFNSLTALEEVTSNINIDSNTLLDYIKYNNDNDSKKVINPNFKTVELGLQYTNTVKTYYSKASRFLLFSKNLIIERDIRHEYSTYPFYFVNNCFKNEETGFSYPAIRFNIQNPKEISKHNINLRGVKTLNENYISFNYYLFKKILPYLTSKFTEKNQIIEYTKINNVIDTLNKLFKEQEFKNINHYTSYFLDFRGRIYQQTQHSFMSIKLLRYIIQIKPENKCKKNSFYYKLHKYIYLIPTIIKNNDKFIEEDLIIILTGFLQLGKIVKNTLLTENKSVSLKSLILEGISIYSNTIDYFIENYKLNDTEILGFLETQIYKLNLFILKKIPFTIIVDSTASGLFHLNSWLKIKPEYLYLLNLADQEEWIDTYSAFFKIVRSYWLNFPEEDAYLFTRSRLKIVLMTIPYNATTNTLLQYFLKNADDNEKIRIKKWFKDFIFYIKLTLKNLFEETIDNLQNHKKFIDKNIFFLGKNKYDFNYYKTEYKDIEHTVYGKILYHVKRNIIYKNNEPVEDLKKTKISLAANLMHSTDAYLLDNIVEIGKLKKIKIHTVHDEFILSVYDFCEFLEIVNNVNADIYYDINKTKVTFNSFFIVI